MQERGLPDAYVKTVGAVILFLVGVAVLIRAFVPEQEWDLQFTLQGHTRAVNSVCFSPDSQRLPSTSDDGPVKVWHGHSGQELLTLKGQSKSVVLSVCFSPDGQRLASNWDSKPDEVKLWDGRSGKLLLTLKGHSGKVRSVCFSPDGERLASASED